jgi:hypothetical protein
MPQERPDEQSILIEKANLQINVNRYIYLRRVSNEQLIEKVVKSK